jgi:hypothetical protein
MPLLPFRGARVGSAARSPHVSRRGDESAQLHVCGLASQGMALSLQPHLRARSPSTSRREQHASATNTLTQPRCMID